MNGAGVSEEENGNEVSHSFEGVDIGSFNPEYEIEKHNL